MTTRTSAPRAGAPRTTGRSPASTRTTSSTSNLTVSSAPPWCGDGGIPSWQFDTIRYVRERAPDVSVHGEVFSPFSQWLEWLDHADALMALVEDPAKVAACLARLADGAAALALGQAAEGADAILISSAFAGAGFISRRQYRTFVLPFERAVVDAVKRAHPDLPVYTHTCGAIGDRLDLMEETGTDGIDTLDPPPLGTVELCRRESAPGSAALHQGESRPGGDAAERQRRRVLRGGPRAAGRGEAARRLHPEQRLFGGAPHAAGEHPAAAQAVDRGWYGRVARRAGTRTDARCGRFRRRSPCRPIARARGAHGLQAPIRAVSPPYSDRSRPARPRSQAS